MRAIREVFSPLFSFSFLNKKVRTFLNRLGRRHLTIFRVWTIGFKVSRFSYIASVPLTVYSFVPDKIKRVDVQKKMEAWVVGGENLRRLYYPES